MRLLTLVAALSLGLAACAPGPNGDGPAFSGPGAPGEGANCVWNNPRNVAPNTPCPTGGS